LNIAIDRIEGWFRASLLLPPVQRSKRLSEVNTLILEQISITKFPLLQKQRGGLVATKSVIQLTSLQLDLRKRIITNQLINFCDQISTLSFSDYSEEGFITHINFMNSCMENILVLSKTSCKEESFLSDTVIDAVSSTCLSSIRRAIQWTVSKSSGGLDDITEVLIRDGKSAWIGGKVCRMYTDRLTKYLKFMAERIPSKFEPTLNAEVVRLTVAKYLMVLMSRYREDKKIRLSKDGIDQIIADLNSIQMFVTSSASAGADKMAFYDETVITSQVRCFIKFEISQILTAFAGTIGACGAPYGLHLYDLLRLCLKLRVDISPRDRRRILSYCTKFLSDLDRVLVDEATFVVIPKGKFIARNILDDLFPEVGIRHCTGKKWSLEAPDIHMDEDVLLEITSLVSDTYGDLKQKKVQSLEARKTSVEHNLLESIRQSVRIDNAALAAAIAEHDRTLAEAAAALSPEPTIAGDPTICEIENISKKPFVSDYALKSETSSTKLPSSSPPLDKEVIESNPVEPFPLISTEDMITDENISSSVDPHNTILSSSNNEFEKSKIARRRAPPPPPREKDHNHNPIPEVTASASVVFGSEVPEKSSEASQISIVQEAGSKSLIAREKNTVNDNEALFRSRPPPPPRKNSSLQADKITSVSEYPLIVEEVITKSDNRERTADKYPDEHLAGSRQRPPPPPRKITAPQVDVISSVNISSVILEEKSVTLQVHRPSPPPPPPPPTPPRKGSITTGAESIQYMKDSSRPPPPPRRNTVASSVSATSQFADGTKAKPPPPPRLPPKV